MSLAKAMPNSQIEILLDFSAKEGQFDSSGAQNRTTDEGHFKHRAKLLNRDNSGLAKFR
jgi:hypothetical protein